MKRVTTYIPTENSKAQWAMRVSRYDSRQTGAANANADTSRTVDNADSTPTASSRGPNAYLVVRKRERSSDSGL